MRLERELLILFELASTAHLARLQLADHAADLHDVQGPRIAGITCTSSNQKQHYNIPLSTLLVVSFAELFRRLSAISIKISPWLFSSTCGILGLRK